MTEWQPISTAPKDGTWILGYRKTRYTWKSVEMWAFAAFETDEDLWINAENSNDFDEQPTHWMPLPTRGGIDDLKRLNQPCWLLWRRDPGCCSALPDCRAFSGGTAVMSDLGKWEIRRKSETSDAGIYEHGLGYVCFVPRPDVHPDLPAMYEKRLNLLFAAPDLYEALKEALALCEGFEDGHHDDPDEEPIVAPVLEKGRAALLKAEGRSE